MSRCWYREEDTGFLSGFEVGGGVVGALRELAQLSQALSNCRELLLPLGRARMGGSGDGVLCRLPEPALPETAWATHASVAVAMVQAPVGGP